MKSFSVTDYILTINKRGIYKPYPVPESHVIPMLTDAFGEGMDSGPGDLKIPCSRKRQC